MSGRLEAVAEDVFRLMVQPISPGWSRRFSPDTIKLLDYVLMDAQTIPNGNGYGETLRIWNFDTYVDDP